MAHTGTLRRAALSALALALALAGCSAAAPPIPAPTPDEPLRGLERYAQRAVEDWGIAGLSIAVVENDSIAFAGGFGVRDVRTGEPVDANTIFAIGSNTKLFTAVSAGLLVEEGKMDWDDPATQHLPGFELYDPYVSREIRIRDLLSHRSGLGRRGDLLWYGSDLSRGEILERVRYLEPNTSFRSTFGYQNIMFLAAGEAVARTAGTTWDEFVSERLLQPLGMRRSSTTTRGLEATDNVATPHNADDGELVAIPYRNIDNIAPAGSINSSALDMAEWLRMLLADGTHAGRRLVDSATIAEVMTPHTITPVGTDSLFPSTHFGAYGLGIGLRDYRGTLLAQHTGGIDGMLSLVAMLPEKDVGIVVLTNTIGHNEVYSALMYRIIDAYLGAGPRDWSAILLRRAEEREARAAEAAESAQAARATGTTPSLAIGEYAGSYEDDLYGSAEIGLENGALVLQLAPGIVADLEHWHYDTFKANWRDGAGVAAAYGMVTFELDARGRVDEMRIPQLAGFDRAAEEEATES